MKLLYLLLISLVVSCATATRNTKMTFASNPVVAHRGAFKKNNYPENSIAALREAIRLGCAGSEFDVRMTADDSLVINHDPHFHQKNIESTTYAELSSTRLSNGEMLPTLHQYLMAGRQDNKQTRLVVEIKPSEVNKQRGQVIAEKVVALVRQLKVEPLVVYISFDYDILLKIRSLDPYASTRYLNGDHSPEKLVADGINGADYNMSVFRKKPEWIPLAQKRNIILNAWTVNNQEDMKWFLSHQFQFITTNEPELLLEITKRK